MTDSAPSPSAAYERKHAEYEQAMAAWKESGRVGPQPLRPVKPHIPGWPAPKPVPPGEAKEP